MTETILNSKDVARAIAQKLDITPEAAEAVLKEFQSVVANHLSGSGEIRMIGFGTFKTVNREAREARNPQTGQKIKVPAHRSVRFVPGKNLKALGGK